MNRNEMLRELQELDFAIQEAVLFLDTHPPVSYTHLDVYKRQSIPGISG